MRIGKRSAPDAFQSTMDVSISSFKRQFELDYLEHYVMFHETLKKYIYKAWKVLFSFKSDGVVCKR